MKSLGVTQLSSYHFLFHPEGSITYTFLVFFSFSRTNDVIWSLYDIFYSTEL